MYCTTEDVRNETGLSTSDINDDKLYKLVQSAVVDLNAMINVRKWDEKVLSINNEKENTIDGANTTFYTRYWPIGDANNDGEISVDDIEAYSLSSAGTRTSLTVATIADDEIGKFTLDSAPSSSVTAYLNYYHAPLDEETPHALIKKTCIELTAAKTYMRVSDGTIKSFKLGSFAIVKEKSTYADYMGRFWHTIRQITAKDLASGVGKNIWD